jgi:hypothetical protein
MDESDTVKNLKTFARNQWIKRAKSLGLISGSDEFEEWLNK